VTPAPVLVEVAVDSAAGAAAAEAAGAGRVELCAALVEGGTTPSAGTIAATLARVRIPVVVLVRARAGDFLYDEAELDTMRRDVEVARSLGAQGVAVGALTADGEVDRAQLDVLSRAAGGMEVVFHRAFDHARDPLRALEALLEAGVHRVLTSGGAPTAAAGVATLAALVREAGARLAVMAGGRVTEESVPALVREAGVREVHVRGAEPVESRMRHRRPDIPFGKACTPDDYQWPATSERLVRRVVEACAGAVR